MKLFNKAAYTGAAGYPGTTAMTQRTLLWEALQTAGLTDQNRTTVIATSTLTVGQCGLLMGNVSGASIVSTLPVAATAVDDAIYLLKRLDTSANSWTIAAGAANTIEGQASVTVPPGGILGIQLPGGSTDWKIIGAAGSPAVLPTGGTLTAYTLTPPIPITAYVRGLTFPVSFTVASGLNPTLAISAVAAPPNLVALQSDGTFANITAGQIPAGHITDVTLLSATQALVVTMPPGLKVPTIQVITATATYIAPAGLRMAVVEQVGGGGGGAGSAAGDRGGSGAGGGYSKRHILAASIGASQSVTIGAGGAGGAAGANVGIAGGTTSFGALCSATGGAGGVLGGSAGAGSLGGIGSGGDVNTRGGPGANPSLIISTPGGSSLLGFGGGTVANSNGQAGTLYGGGGGSQSDSGGTTARAGGAGAAGVVVVTEFY